MEIVQATNGSHLIKSFSNLHEAGYESVWLRFIIQYIEVLYPIVLHKDNVEYTAQIKGRYIKGHRMKPISSNSFTLMSFGKAMKLTFNN